MAAALSSGLGATGCQSTACTQAPATEPPSPAASALSGPSAVDPAAPCDAPHAVSFALDPDALRREGAGDSLLEKLARSRYRYFRMLAEPYEVRTCEAFRERSAALPVLAVHGDPHLEQFVVTSTTYGLEDFDRSGFGPAVVDLVRYSASLHVACADATWACDPEAAVEGFLDAYRASLTAPPPDAPAPRVVERVRGKAPRGRREWVDWAESLMSPLPTDVEAGVRRRWRGFEGTLHELYPERPVASFDIERVGGLTMGIGSALERKLLLRVAGPTAAPDDDLVIEAREGTAPKGDGCVWRASYGESLILMFIAVLGRRLPDVHGFVPLVDDEHRFWVQSWDPGYVELSLGDLTGQSELEEVAVDAARQLGGHLWSKFPRPLLPYQLRAQREAFDETRAQVTTLSRELARESIQAWERFGLALRKQSNSTPPTARERVTLLLSSP